MSRDARYQKLLNSKRWAEVKAFVDVRAEGLCERCKREGFITPGKDHHHIIPVESANPDDPKAMERLAYDVNNIELLCVPCHIKTHQDMQSHKADKVAENKRRGAERRASWLDPNYEANQGEGQGSKVDDPSKTPI